jgi:hypothetical protein
MALNFSELLGQPEEPEEPEVSAKLDRLQVSVTALVQEMAEKGLIDTVTYTNFYHKLMEDVVDEN